MGFLQRLDLTYLNDIYFFQVAKKKATQIKKAPPPPEVKELSIEDDIDEVVVKNWLDNNFISYKSFLTIKLFWINFAGTTGQNYSKEKQSSK